MDTSLGLTAAEYRLLKSLDTPLKMQSFLDTLPINYEKRGETHYSPRMVLREHKCHCIEAALLAATAFWLNGRAPLIMDIKSVRGDDGHVIAPFKINGFWGAVSKSNHATIRWRDPVYKTPRELVMSYFHEWFIDATGVRTLRSYTEPFDLSTLDPKWVTSEKNLWYLDKILEKQKHYPIAPSKNMKMVRRADKMERKAGSILEWSKKDKRT